MASPPRDPHRSNAVSAGDVKQARSTHDKSGGHLTPTEVKSELRLPMVFERAREDGNLIVGQKETRAAAATRTAFGSYAIRARIRVSKVLSRWPRRIDAGQYRMQVATADEPTDWTNELRMVAKSDDALGRALFDAEMRGLHTY